MGFFALTTPICGNDQRAGFDELRDFVIVIPGRCQHQRLQHTHGQATRNDLGAGRPLERFDGPGAALHACIEEGVQRAQFLAQPAFPVEVHREFPSQPGGLRAAHAFVDSSTVGRQTHRVFQAGVEPVQQIQHVARQLGRVHDAAVHLLDFRFDGQRPFVWVAVAVFESGLPAVFLKLHVQLAPLAGLLAGDQFVGNAQNGDRCFSQHHQGFPAQFGAAQVDDAAQHVTGQVGQSERRVVLGVDRCQPAG